MKSRYHTRAKSADRVVRRTRIQLDTWHTSLSLLAWLLALVALWQLTGVPPASGYELSIYDVLPPPFLYVLQTSLALHVAVTVWACFRHARSSSHFPAAISGIAGVVFATTVALSLPHLRGYVSLIGDFSTHVALSAQIADVGSIGKDVFYPALYSLVQVVHAATGLDVSQLWSFGTAVWYVLYVLLCIMVAGRLLANSRAALFAGLAAAIPPAGAYLRLMYPASVSVFLLPLLFYLYTGSRHGEGRGFNVMLILLLLCLPFLHPLTSLIAILWLAMLEAARWALARFPSWQQSTTPSQRRQGVAPASLTPSAALILAITWLAWISSFVLWNQSIRQVADWLSGEARTQLARIDYLAGRSGLSTLGLVQLVFRQESGVIIFTGLALVSLPLLLLLMKKQRAGARIVRYLVPLYALLTLSVLAAGFAIVGPLGSLDFYRFSRFVVPWSALILAAVPLLANLLGSRARFSVAVVVVCAFIIVALGGLWALHPSPWTFQPNEQMTVQEVNCLKWIYDAGDGRAIRGIWGLRRQADIALGPSIASSLPSLGQPLPDHFAYDSDSSLEKVFSGPGYLLITEYDRATVLDLWASVDKYAPEDFIRLQADAAATLLYDSFGCQVWSIQTTGALDLP